MKKFKAHLRVKSQAKPVFHRPRAVPYAIKEIIEKELDRLEKEGIIEKVEHSDWAAPIVPVPKGDGQIHLCGDYKVTVNANLEVDQHPLPKPEDLFMSLAGGQKFSKLDLKHAYQQMMLDSDSRKYVTINTQRDCIVILGYHSELPLLWQFFKEQWTLFCRAYHKFCVI